MTLTTKTKQKPNEQKAETSLEYLITYRSNSTTIYIYIYENIAYELIVY